MSIFISFKNIQKNQSESLSDRGSYREALLLKTYILYNNPTLRWLNLLQNIEQRLARNPLNFLYIIICSFISWFVVSFNRLGFSLVGGIFLNGVFLLKLWRFIIIFLLEYISYIFLDRSFINFKKPSFKIILESHQKNENLEDVFIQNYRSVE